MKLYFSGLENSIVVERGSVTTFEIHNAVLFERICRSLMLNDGENPIEPYTVCDDDEEILASRNAMLFIASPLDLPWGNREMGGALLQRMLDAQIEDPDTASAVDTLFQQLASRYLTLALRLQSDYCFSYDWDVQRFLKAFGFGIDSDRSDSTLDNCMRFLSLAYDVSFSKPLVFCGLKQFLSCNEQNQVFTRVFLLNLPVLLVESVEDVLTHPHERKYVVDQHFLES